MTNGVTVLIVYEREVVASHYFLCRIVQNFLCRIVQSLVYQNWFVSECHKRVKSRPRISVEFLMHMVVLDFEVMDLLSRWINQVNLTDVFGGPELLFHCNT